MKNYLAARLRFRILLQYNWAVSGSTKRPDGGSLAGLVAAHAISTLD